MSGKREVSEFSIEVPWGHLAGKSWGDPKNEIVLVFHGLLDNAGSFNGLIEYLPDNFCYKCFDLPGHGKSSHFPVGVAYYAKDNFFAYKIIVDYFKQGSYIFIGHSYGGQIAMAFTQIYPEYAKKIVVIDTFFIYPVTRNNFKDYYRDVIVNNLEIMEKLRTKKQPEYSYKVALDKLTNGRAYGDVTDKAALDLFERATVKTEDGERYKFTVDQRLKQFIRTHGDFRHMIAMLKKYPITCPVLIIMASESNLQYTYFKSFVNELRKSNCTLKSVKGNHNVHMNNPDIVGPIIKDFIEKRKHKL